MRHKRSAVFQPSANAVLRWLLLAFVASLAISAKHVTADTESNAAAMMPLPRNRGTGFFIDAEGNFLTANHVIGGCKTNSVLTPDGIIAADLVARSQQHDVAVIRTRNKPVFFGRFSANPAQEIRHPLTVRRFLTTGGLASASTTTGRFLGKTPVPNGHFALKTKDTIVGGNSGSPVIDDRGGIVGMLVARASKDRRVAIAVDAFTITAFLSRQGIKVETIAAGEYAPVARSVTDPREYTFAVLCITPKKNRELNPN